MINPVVIFGAKGLGKTALDIFKSNDVVVYCFLDDDASLHGTEIEEVSVLGATDDDGYLKVIGQKCDAFVAHDDNKVRKSSVKMLNDRRKVMPINAIHHTSYLATSTEIGHGNLINAQSVLGAFVKMGNHCVVSMGVRVEQETLIEDYVQIGTGSNIGANVTLHDGAFIGSGVTIVSGVVVGKNARVGAGSVVIANVADGETVFGNPAKKV